MVLVREFGLRNQVVVAQHAGFGETGGATAEEASSSPLFCFVTGEADPVLFAVGEQRAPAIEAGGDWFVMVVEN